MKVLALLAIAVTCCAADAVLRQIDRFDTSAGPVTITPINHASLVLQANAKTIYVDPTSKGNYDGLPQPDLILITDVHGDHMDANKVAAIRKADTAVVVPKAVQQTIVAAVPMNNGEKMPFDKWTIEAVPMYNLKRGPSEGKFYHDKGRGNGYVLTYGGKRFYIAGDTEGIPEMRALKNIDVAFVPMNLPFTMTPEEAADAVKAFSPKVVIPYHYGKSDLAVFSKALEGTGIDVRIRNWYY